MGSKFQFNISAQLWENNHGDLAIRFANNLVFEAVGIKPGKGFALEATQLLEKGDRPQEWRLIPFRKLLHDGQNWHVVSSMGYLDGDESKPALVLEVKVDELGHHAKQYLKNDMPKTLQ